MKTDEHLLQGQWIGGVEFRPLDEKKDARGSFTEVFYNSWKPGIEPAQWSVVRSRARTLRGMHLHLRHDEYVSVILGSACVGLYDLRQDSPTRGQSCLIALKADSPACLTFPRGLVHGWYFHEDSIHLQAVSETYEDYGDDDNRGCHFSDPDLGIDWPDKEPVLSERAREFPGLKDLCASLGALER